MRRAQATAHMGTVWRDHAPPETYCGAGSSCARGEQSKQRDEAEPGPRGVTDRPFFSQVDNLE